MRNTHIDNETDEQYVSDDKIHSLVSTTRLVILSTRLIDTS